MGFQFGRHNGGITKSAISPVLLNQRSIGRNQEIDIVVIVIVI